MDAVRRLLDRGETVTTITIDGICAEADVSRSSFYLRWPSKDALWADVAAEYLDEAVATVERTRVELVEIGDLSEFAERIGIAYVTWIFDHRHEAVAFAELVEVNPAVAETMNQFTAMMMDSVATEVAWRVGLDGVPLPPSARLEMSRLVEVLLATVHRAVADDTRFGELRSMSPQEFTEWFGPMSRGMASIFSDAVRGPGPY